MPGIIIEYRCRESFSNAWLNNLSLEFQREIPVERYAAVRSFFERIHATEQAPVVLIKK